MNTKSLLVVSLSLNLLLAGSGGYIWFTSVSPIQPMLPAPPAVPVAVAATPAPISWSQIESESPLIYMDHLHAIGCPEATIRRILDLDKLSNPAVGETPAVASNGSGTFAGARQSLPAGQPQSQQGSGPVTSSFAGSSTGYTADAAATGSFVPMGAQGGAVGAQNNAAPAPAIPLAFQAANLLEASPAPMNAGIGSGARSAPGAAAVLNDDQKAAITGVQNEFANQLNGTSQNPNDPVYAQKWNAAQRLADEQLKAAVGYQQYNLMQMHAAQQAAQGAK